LFDYFSLWQEGLGILELPPSESEAARWLHTLVVIWQAADRTAEEALRLTAQRLHRDPSKIVLGMCLGGAPSADWPFPVITLPNWDFDPARKTLTAALDCIVEMLLVLNAAIDGARQLNMDNHAGPCLTPLRARFVRGSVPKAGTDFGIRM
jgi:hypothetical protein